MSGGCLFARPFQETGMILRKTDGINRDDCSGKTLLIRIERMVLRTQVRGV